MVLCVSVCTLCSGLAPLVHLKSMEHLVEASHSILVCSYIVKLHTSWNSMAYGMCKLLCSLLGLFLVVVLLLDDDQESGIQVSDGEAMDTDTKPCGPASPDQSGLPHYWHKRLRSFSVGELPSAELVTVVVMLQYPECAPVYSACVPPWGGRSTLKCDPLRDICNSIFAYTTTHLLHTT